MHLTADNISFGVSSQCHLNMIALLDGGVELLVESPRVLGLGAGRGSLLGARREIRGSAERVVLTKEV